MHVPVLAGAVLEYLNVKADGVYVDCTVGAGGHSALIAAHLDTGLLIGIDRDASAAAKAAERLQSFSQAHVVHNNYACLLEILQEMGANGADGVLIDAGVSSMQLDDAGRGFSFQEDGPLDMRMDPSEGSSARDLLMRISESELASLLKTYGDLRKAKTIARGILKTRDQGPLETTGDLAKAVGALFPHVRGIPQETRQVFQAIRIAVNDELAHLEIGLQHAVAALNAGGRLVAISFHSGEDRIVKNVLREASRPRRILHPDGRVKETAAPLMTLLTARPVVPGEDEIRRNPRAHSAKLRAAEKRAA